MTFLGKVHVTLKDSVLDPQGTTVKHAVTTLGFEQVQDVRVGKYIEIKLEGKDQKEAHKTLQSICEKLLHNPVIEAFTFEIVQL